MAKIPAYLPKDPNGYTVQKFLDMFEYVWGDGVSSINYFGYLHGDGVYVITQVTDPGTAVEHIKFYIGLDGGAALATLWASRAGLTYVEYDALY